MPQQPPLTLAIEISNPTARDSGRLSSASDRPTAGVALGRIGPAGVAHVLGSEWLRPDAGHDEDLMSAIDRLFARAGASPADIRRIAISAGPGGFTSLRIGAAVAKMIALATGAACVAVPTTAALIRRVDPALRRDRPTAICLAWKRRDAWRVTFSPGDSHEPIGPGGLAPLSALVEPGPFLLVADDPLVQLLREEGLVHRQVTVLAPRFDPVAVLEASAFFADVDPSALAPIYPREPEAVARWRDRPTARGQMS